MFGQLVVINDVDFRAAALNMAVDEALLESSLTPSIRFYRWDHPALSFGYFGRFADVSDHCERDLVRRWTGGGIVFHGHDLTYALLIPASNPASAESAAAIYEKTHRAIQRALLHDGLNAELAPVASISDRWSQQCFASPVRADLMLKDCKIAGAAQRRTTRGLLQQGSIQNVELGADFPMRFARELSARCLQQSLSPETLHRAAEIAAEKYAAAEWLRKR